MPKYGILYLFIYRKDALMFLRTITIKGITRLYFYESYYENGKTKQKCVENLGRLDELKKQFDDPLSHFKKTAEQRTQEKGLPGRLPST